MTNSELQKRILVPGMLTDKYILRIVLTVAWLHIEAFLAKLARRFCKGVALGLFNIDLACSYTDYPAALADAVNLPLFLSFIWIVSFLFFIYPPFFSLFIKLNWFLILKS